MKRFAGFAAVMAMVVIGLAGCGGSDGPVTAAPPAGTGYRVGLQASDQTLVSGTTVLLTAWAYGPDGNLVMTDTDGISFSASLKGTFDNSGKGKITGGTAVSNFTWEDTSGTDNPDPSRVLRITAVYHGAVSSVELTAVSKTF